MTLKPSVSGLLAREWRKCHNSFMAKQLFTVEETKAIGETLGVDLNEFPGCYTRLAALEKEADDYWKNKN